ncbi:NAD(P)H-hydrate dehydratase [Aliiglaciecola sp. CAU 1673]|uniref:NAD(P)H-hydrate dehydratase n=1 Tax=Aliiglaciecola sp. CAU 1673 TaxID=3032595 RepID=UPI0023DA390F|nr:NAD(P)H-hydrate dehydratase [Aliiglaciecola sp. CAU 1673]MDF2180398.1 NAD(P)H-hydrate dehydratase [Aliiglaciecola sp. CAU 1673]
MTLNTYQALKMPPSLAHKVYSAETVRSQEPLAAEQAAVPMYDLMERAGAAAFDCLKQAFPKTKRILVLAGHGNNGGDGFVVARLAKAGGMHVTLCLVGDINKLTPDTTTARKKWLDCGGTVGSWPQPDQAFDLIVDAMLGTGIQGKVREPYQIAITWVNQSSLPVLSIDLPSGLNADTGAPCGEAVRASHTISFVGVKSGLVTGRGKGHCGQLHFTDLGIGNTFNTLAKPVAMTIGFDNLASLPRRAISSHKGDHGKLLCIGGGPGLAGAMRLCAEAALRSGAGLVKVLCHPSCRTLVAQGRPEIMLADEEDYQVLFDWADGFAIGPGLGQSDWAKTLFTQLISYQQRRQKPMVLDADGLNLLANLPAKLAATALITPHPAEAARLLECTTSAIEDDRYKAIQALADRFDAQVILKGAGSLIQSEHQCFVCQDGNPGMAVGGMGDTLTGIAAGLMIQGMPVSEVAKLAPCLHAKAADMAAEAQGERGMMASDLLPYVRTLVNR